MGLERAHVKPPGKRERLSVVRLGRLDVGRDGVGVDGTKLEQRARLVRTRLLLSGQVKRLVHVLPGLGEASGEEIDRAEMRDMRGVR